MDPRTRARLRFMVPAVVALHVLIACSFRDFDKLTAAAPDSGAGGADAAAPIGDGGDADRVDPDLIGWWKLDEGAGQVAFDSSGNQNHGTLEGAVSWVDGRVGGGIALDGINGLVFVPSSASLKTAIDALTIAFWLQADDVPGVDERLVRMGYIWETKLNGAARTPRFARASGYATMVYSVPVREWHHLAFVFDRGRIAAYVDGDPAELGDDTLTAGVPLSSDDFGFVLGASPERTDYCKCRFDDVRLYRRALTGDELARVTR